MGTPVIAQTCLSLLRNVSPWDCKGCGALWRTAQPLGNGRWASLPILLEKPGHTSHDTPRSWRGQSVLRKVDVEYADGHIPQAKLRFVVIHASALAQ